jgi:hypothetical protein
MDAGCTHDRSNTATLIKSTAPEGQAMVESSSEFLDSVPKKERTPCSSQRVKRSTCVVASNGLQSRSLLCKACRLVAYAILGPVRRYEPRRVHGPANADVSLPRSVLLSAEEASSIFQPRLVEYRGLCRFRDRPRNSSSCGHACPWYTNCLDEPDRLWRLRRSPLNVLNVTIAGLSFLPTVHRSLL